MRLITCLLFCGILLLPSLVLAQDSDTSVRVRVGKHATFSRIVFDWPTKAPYRVEQSDGRATVHFDRSGTLDLSRYERNPPPMVKGISPRTADGGLAVDIDIPAGAKLRHFFNGTHIVVDVMKPGAGATQSAAKPKAAPPAAAAAAAATQAKPRRTARGNQLATTSPAEGGGRNTQPNDYVSRIISSDRSTRPARTAYNDSSDTSSSSSWLSDTRFDPHFTIGTNTSTLGFGGEAGVRLNDFVGLRIGGNYFGYDTDNEYEDVEYDIDVNLLSGGAVVDVYPFGGGFRLTGGLRYNDNNAGLEAEPSGNVDIGGQTFTPTEVGTLDGKVKFNSIAPYAGVGFEGIFLNGNLSLALDLGVLYQGKPDVNLDSDGTLQNDPTFQDALDDEIDEIEDDLSFLGFYPVIGVSANLRF